jgi:hypothetical protein
VLPESVRQRLLMAVAQEQERAARESEAPPPEEEAVASQGRTTAPGGTDPPHERTPSREEKAPPERAAALGKAGPPHKAGHPESVEPAGPFVPRPRRPPRAHDRPAKPPAASWHAAPASSSAVRDEALTQPFPKVPEPVEASPGALVDPSVPEPAPRRERSASVPDRPAAAAPRTPAVSATPAAAVPAPSGHAAGQQGGREKPRPGRGYRAAGVLISVSALIAAGALALTFYGRSAGTTAARGHQHPPGDGQMAALDRAAAWVADQVGRTTTVAADPAMCRVLEAHGVPARGLYELGPETTSPLRSAVIVATPAVRAQFGTLLNSVYAPAVLASFGSGPQRVDIREIAQRGAAAYRSALAADLAARKSTGAELLRSNRIVVSLMAREQLSAGQVDSRLLITIAAMAAKRPIYIAAFHGFAPGADASLPLRFVDLTQASSGQLAGSRRVTPAFVRSMAAFLYGPDAPYRPLRVETAHLAGGRVVLRIEFAAPSPLGLIGPP